VVIVSLVLALREGLESALLIGIFLSVLRKINRADLRRPLWLGIISAGGVSILVAMILLALDREFEGVTEQVFEGSTLFFAAAVLTWMIFWMRRQSVNMKSSLESKINYAASLRGWLGVFSLAFLAVVREGFELALYLSAASLASNGVGILFGTLSGLLLAGSLAYLIYNTTLHLNLQRFFSITAIFLIVFAAGLIAQGVAEFNQAGIIPTIINPIWNLNPLLNDRSIIGTIFSTLFGYHGKPSLTEALGYSVYIFITLGIFVKARNLQVN
jgi:high-affinity iron transporter